jgi:hypothetical protein
VRRGLPRTRPTGRYANAERRRKITFRQLEQRAVACALDHRYVRARDAGKVRDCLAQQHAPQHILRAPLGTYESAQPRGLRRPKFSAPMMKAGRIDLMSIGQPDDGHRTGLAVNRRL